MLSDNMAYWQTRIEALAGLTDETVRMVNIEELCDQIVAWKSEEAKAGGEELQQMILNALDHEVAVLKACTQALDDLQEFSVSILEFFVHGFYGRPRKLDPSQEYPPPMVMNTLLTEISNDLGIFQRILHQRKLIEENISAHLFILSVGDRVASAALQPAFNAKYLHKGVVVTQLGDDFNVRLIPYYDMLLIEVPFTTGSILSGAAIRPVPDTEHLGILHEIGHHVYKFGIVPGTNQTFEEYLTQQLYEVGITGGLANWLEEIFADVYGLLIAGPVMVLSYQELLSQKPNSYLVEDTGEHPIPILRPFILTQALRLVESSDKSSAGLYGYAPDILDASWLKFLGKNDVREAIYKPQGVFRPISGTMIVEGLIPILLQILDALRALRPYALKSAWTTGLSQEEDVSALREQLKEARFLDAVEPPKGFSTDETPWQVEKYNQLADKSLPVEKWLPLFGFPGWTTEFLQATPAGVGDMPKRG